MLRACRRRLADGGRIAFTTIIVSDGLSKKDHRRAARMGPRAVSSTRPIGTLMLAAGFEGVDVTDVSERFVATARSWFDAFASREEDLPQVMHQEYRDRQKGRQDLIAATREGLLKRVLVTGTA